MSGFSRTSLEPVNLGDIGMVERGEDLGFALEPYRIRGQRRRQNLDRYVAFQLAVARAVDLAHTAGAERRDDFVGPEAGAGHEGQGVDYMGRGTDQTFLPSVVSSDIEIPTLSTSPPSKPRIYTDRYK